MSKTYRTVRGKDVDMDKLKIANETTIAVGNMRTNARGDILGPGSTIAVPRNQVMDRVYAVPDGDVGYSPTDSINMARQALLEANAKELNDLATNSTVPVTVEVSNPAPVQPAARGSLASSVAKTATVNQQPVQKAGSKNSGPSRI